MDFYEYFHPNILCEERVLFFLKSIDKDFPVPLSQKVGLNDYARKLCEKAYIITAEHNGYIKGMLAGYVNELENNMAYISVLGVCKDVRKQGIADSLVKQFIVVCKERYIKGIHVYAVKTNKPALLVYKKNGFTRYKCEKEKRPKDEHLILDFEMMGEENDN